MRYNELTESEYTKKINDNYLDNYYDTMYGKQTKDEEGNMTGKRIFNFDASLMPGYKGDLDYMFSQTGSDRGLVSKDDLSKYRVW